MGQIAGQVQNRDLSNDAKSQNDEVSHVEKPNPILFSHSSGASINVSNEDLESYSSNSSNSSSRNDR